MLDVNFGRIDPALREVLPVAEREQTVRLGFERTVPKGVLPLVRTHPFVEGLSGYVMQSALDPAIGGKARRAGVIRTRRVSSRTTLFLVRFRYHLILGRAGEASPLLAEECQVLAFEGAPAEARWLDPAEAERLKQRHGSAAKDVPPSQGTGGAPRDRMHHHRPHGVSQAQAGFTPY